eukprot:TRINITY_DN13898_c0_g1_i1.p1 TRINITY_DN13898_c0_g1~~TRINITY_DN13898_c0_g1_i1.p1  ORF type:complete len:398 (+),score=100.46 TRINITY_DN13898_c0_g1_i1:89-1282(+)
MSAAKIAAAALTAFALGIAVGGSAVALAHSNAQQQQQRGAAAAASTPPPSASFSAAPAPLRSPELPQDDAAVAEQRAALFEGCSPLELQVDERTVWPPSQDEDAAKLLRVRRDSHAAFIQACRSERSRWQAGHRRGAARARAVGRGGCVESAPELENTTRPDVFVLRGAAGIAPGRRRVFVDAGAGKFAQLWPSRTAPTGREWRLGSVAQFVCGYPNGHTFDLFAFEPQWSKYAGLKHERMAGSALQGPVYVGYPTSVHVQWKGAGTSDGEMILAGWGHGARFVAGAAAEQVESEQRKQKRGKVKRLSVVDLAAWLLRNTAPSDYVVLKLDVEGMEHRIIPHLVQAGAWPRVAELFIECHDPDTGVGNVDMKPRFPVCRELRKHVIHTLGTPFHDWP